MRTRWAGRALVAVALALAFLLGFALGFLENSRLDNALIKAGLLRTHVAKGLAIRRPPAGGAF